MPERTRGESGRGKRMFKKRKKNRGEKKNLGGWDVGGMWGRSREGREGKKVEGKKGRGCRDMRGRKGEERRKERVGDRKGEKKEVKRIYTKYM